MAVTRTTETDFGITVDNAYWRLNNFDELPNRQADGSYLTATARFRAFASASAFHGGSAFLAEQLVTFTPSGIGANLAEEAYAALKAREDFAGAVDA